MAIGLIMYFYYGITHSSLENPNEEIELTVDQPNAQNTNHISGRGGAGVGENSTPSDYHPTTAVWDRHGYENKMAEESWSQSNFSEGSWSTAKAPVDHAKTWGDSSKSKAGGTVQQPTSKVDNGFGIFVEETQYPTWDD